MSITATNTSEQHAADDGDSVSLSVAGNDLTLFVHSTTLIASMLADIKAAKQRVWLESYIFAEDDAGRAVAEALSERAQAGLDVRLTIDAIGSVSTSAALIERMRSAGVKVHEYHNFRDIWRKHPLLSILGKLNRRDHRKLLVIDDEVAYFGGMNIVDQSGIKSVADAKAKNLPKSAGWRDLHVRLVGSGHAEIAEAFDRLWRHAHHLPKRPWPRWNVAQILRNTAEAIYFFDFRPTHRGRRPQRVFVPLIRQSEHEITVSMAYFVPVGRVLKELIRAARRGVKITVIVPGQSDVKAARWASRYFYAHLLKRGIQIFERKDQMLHSKTMVVDGRWTVIGSCNLDPRSLHVNIEFLGLIRSPELAEAVAKICRFEIAHSVEVTQQMCDARSIRERILDRLAWSVRWFL